MWIELEYVYIRIEEKSFWLLTGILVCFSSDE